MSGSKPTVFVETPGGQVGLRELADAEVVVGVMPDGSGRVLKNREGREGEVSAECVTWLRANPTKNPEDFYVAPIYRCHSCDVKELHYYHWFEAPDDALVGARLIFDDTLIVES